MFPDLIRLAGRLDEEVHLAVCEFCQGGFEIVAVGSEAGWQDAFPLPVSVQAAAAEEGVLLENRMAARVELSQYPEDFWEDVSEHVYEGGLRTSVMGRSAQKYLRVYRAVSRGETAGLVDLGLTQLELARVAKWLRDEKLFDRRNGAEVMAALLSGSSAIRKSKVFHLQMIDRRDHLKRQTPEGLSVSQVVPGDGAFNAKMYREVGRNWQWKDRLVWVDKAWDDYVAREELETWKAEYEGEACGYFELDVQPNGSVEIVYFGLLPSMIGKGLGGAMLSLAVERAWTVPGTIRVWLHTCSEDHAHALANYEKRGFRIFKVEEE